jgi:hypothetical protein
MNEFKNRQDLIEHVQLTAALTLEASKIGAFTRVEHSGPTMLLQTPLLDHTLRSSQLWHRVSKKERYYSLTPLEIRTIRGVIRTGHLTHQNVARKTIDFTRDILDEWLNCLSAYRHTIHLGEIHQYEGESVIQPVIEDIEGGIILSLTSRAVPVVFKIHDPARIGLFDACFPRDYSGLSDMARHAYDAEYLHNVHVEGRWEEDSSDNIKRAVFSGSYIDWSAPNQTKETE